MKAWWTLQAARIDALSLRERAFLFLSLLVVLGALADTLWLSPAKLRQSQAAASVKQQELELRGLREVLRTTVSSAGNNSKQGAQLELSQLSQRLQDTNGQIAAVSGALGSNEGLQKVLTQFLRRYEGLTLVHTATLANDGVATGVGRAGPTGSAAATAVPGLKRQSMELTVAGAYLDLMHYVQTLEQELPGLRWGDMKLKSEGGKVAQLTLQVSLLSLTP